MLTISSIVLGCAPHTKSALATRQAIAAHRERGDAAYKAKDYATCAVELERAAALTHDHGGAHYNAACCHALAGDRDRAFAALGHALDRGFYDVATFDRDTDLATLRGDARWSAAVARVKANDAAFVASINHELYQMFTDDQADRAGDSDKIDWKIVAPRDEARHARVLALVAAGSLKSAPDFYHAAMVLQHGHAVEDYATAARLAERAATLDPALPGARWLAAAATDRELMTLGKPQRYGTQFRLVDDKWIVWPCDPAITDEERAAHDVPPLAEAQARAAEMNHKP